jgi:hypothetical protein
VIDVWIAPDPSRPCDGELVARIGYWSFCFLEPMFRTISNETGESFDLYGDARFGGGEHLALLDRTLVAQRAALVALPDPVDVSEHGRTAIRLEKRAIEQLIVQLLDGVRTATMRNWLILFLGD